MVKINLSNDKIVENKRLNRNLMNGSLLGILLAMVPPVVLPIEDTKYTQGIVRHKDQNVALYSLALGYIGLVSSFVLYESRQGREKITRLIHDLDDFYRNEDKRAITISL